MCARFTATIQKYPADKSCCDKVTTNPSLIADPPHVLNYLQMIAMIVEIKFNSNILRTRKFHTKLEVILI